MLIFTEMLREDGETGKAEANGAMTKFPQIRQKYEKIRGAEKSAWLKFGYGEVKAQTLSQSQNKVHTGVYGLFRRKQTHIALPRENTAANPALPTAALTNSCPHGRKTFLGTDSAHGRTFFLIWVFCHETTH